MVVEELSTRMVAAGNEVDAYNRKGHHVSGKSFEGKSNGNLSEYKGIKILVIPTFRNGNLNAFIYSVLATFRALFGHYDCIHFHAEGPCAMLWLPHLCGIRTVATIHGLDWQRAKWGGFAVKYLRFGEKIAAKYADKIVVLSKNMKQYFMDEHGRKVEFIPNGISKPVKRGTNIISQKWGLQKDTYILFLARVVPEKGLHYLIDAYRELNTSLKLVIVGGSSHTDGYIMEIKRKAAEDRRIIITDFVQGEELEELYSNSYLYVLPSDVEGMPLSLLEAMSYGNCCVVSDIAECTEIIEDKAVSFKKSNVDDLRDKLQWLIDNVEIVEVFKKEASSFIIGKYNWDVIVRETLRLYAK
ncbi:glycosyltransferase family 4 protein [Desulfosporosinus sp. SB140]|uniref:glycosyltransferase family 4 protein n=1 Tax=Desulfosporosinus paludis TaxID=3115649 RepID=UPI00388D1B6B